MSEMEKAIAHVRKNADGSWAEPQELEDHIEATAQLAAQFSSFFNNADWGKLAGLWHDLGKYQADFQNYIRESSGYKADETNEGGPGRVDHSVVGALWAKKRYATIAPAFGKALGYIIAGHHAGLPDWYHEVGIGGSLEVRLRDRSNLASALRNDPPQVILNAKLALSAPGNSAREAISADEMREQLHLWIRMLFSCLVDADFLDTESYMDPQKSERRNAPVIDLAEAKDRLDRYLEDLGNKAPQTSVNKIRREILAACRSHAGLGPGMFSLTVPTGGGKTLAGMAFAIEHALKHGKRRVIVAIPYTSIIEQTADVYRSVFGPEAVLEHHSNIDPDAETLKSKLASENWDAPIIVTTNVQLFESLFAAKTSACRKLHNIAQSVIILDEAQTLPVEFLQPAVSAMKGLVDLFGVSIVLSTATQPALAGRIESGMARLSGFPDDSVREIMDDPKSLARKLKRVEVVRHPAGENRVPWEELAGELADYPQVLCIVNTRKDCRALYELLPSGTVHLSALMCPEHRSKVIANIKTKLDGKDELRVVSTQLVEAGVDIDFPVVYRALSGLDSIAQAAGRCNREGRLDLEGRLGKVVIFTPPQDAPAGMLRKGQDAGSEMLRAFPTDSYGLTPEAFDRYFKLFYSRVNSFDQKEIMRLLVGPDIDDIVIQFRTAASRFSLIDDGGQRSVIVWYEAIDGQGRKKESSESLVAKIEAMGPDRATLRKLQRYSVNIPRRIFDSLAKTNAIRAIKGMDGLYIQSASGLYDATFGLKLEGPTLSIEETIV